MKRLLFLVAVAAYLTACTPSGNESTTTPPVDSTAVTVDTVSVQNQTAPAEQHETGRKDTHKADSKGDNKGTSSTTTTTTTTTTTAKDDNHQDDRNGTETTNSVTNRGGTETHNSYGNRGGAKKTN